jgi:hypothetical protein
VERELDSLELRDGPPAITRVRPALIFQRDIGSQVARYFFGPLVPKGVVGLARMPVLPVPDSVVFQCVHADDVADALWRILNSRSVGAFNLAATPVLTPRELAKVFRGRRGTLSDAFLREVVEMTWRLRLQPTDPGWIDLATSVPVMSTARAREDLGWYARRDARATMADLLDGIRAGAGTTSPVLAPRSRFLGSRNGRPQAEHLRTDRRARSRSLRVEQRAPDGRDIDLRRDDSELVGP